MSITISYDTPLLDRSEWGARPPKTQVPAANPVEGSVDHYTGNRVWPGDLSILDHNRCAPLLRGIQAYHMDANGWSDIAYNFAGCPHRVAYTLRGFGRNGANGTAHYNATTFTILWLIGKGDPWNDGLAMSMALTTRAIIDWCEYAGGAAKRRRGHRDVRTSSTGQPLTECPGDAIEAISINNWYVPPAPPPPRAEVVAMAHHPVNGGYWMVDAKGAVAAFGGAPFLGDLSHLALGAPVVDIKPTPTGNGYWLYAADGGVFAFGAARYLGSMGGTPLAAPVTSGDPTPTGNGYVLSAADGGVFAFGDARFHGSWVA